MNDFNETKPDRPLPAHAPAAQDDPLWLRILYMAFIALLAYLAFWAALATGLVQLVVKLVSRDINPEIDGISKFLVKFMGDAIAYVTFVSDDKPFPFRPL